MIPGQWDLFVVCGERDTMMVSSLQIRFEFCTPTYGQLVSFTVKKLVLTDGKSVLDAFDAFRRKGNQIFFPVKSVSNKRLQMRRLI